MLIAQAAKLLVRGALGKPLGIKNVNGSGGHLGLESISDSAVIVSPTSVRFAISLFAKQYPPRHACQAAPRRYDARMATADAANERPVMSSKTLDRGLRVLAAVADAPEEGVAPAELASRLGLHRAQVYRMLGTLAEHRLVRRVQSSRYVLGVGIVEMAGRVAGSLQAAATPHLHSLAEDLRATAFLSVADGDGAVAVAVAEPRGTAFHVAYRVGYRHPLTRGAPGLAILAGRPAAAGDMPDVLGARDRGYASTSSQLEPGAMGVAAPIRAPGGLEASVGIVTLEGRLDEASAGSRVVEAAHAISDAARRS